MKKSLLFALFLISLIPVFSQGADEAYNVKQDIRSPQVADIIRFDRTGGTVKKTGRLDLNIELTRIRDRDFDMPVTLSYNSAGFVPSKAESYVGLNWFINTGGVITREVKGVPDDLVSWYQGPGRSAKIYGFVYFHKNKGVFKKNMDIEYIDFNRPSSSAVFCENKYIQDNNLSFNGIEETETYADSGNSLRSCDTYIDGSSDIYHFSFGPHSGKFMINFDGSVSAISNAGGKYEVDLSDFDYANYEIGRLASTIRIITDDGYIYSFGGSFDNVEYSYSWTNPFESNGGIVSMTQVGVLQYYQAHISSYHLYKIEAPNGRTLHIEYSPVSKDMHTWSSAPYSFSQHLLQARLGHYSQLLKHYRRNFICSWHTNVQNRIYFSSNNGNDQNVVIEPRHNLTKIALPLRIYTDNQEITFEYENSQYSPFDNLSDLNNDIKFEKEAGAELQRITLSSFGENKERSTVSSSAFSYRPWSGSTGSRRLLESLLLSTAGKYSFSYNTDKQLPSPVTFNIDFWNYWRGNSLNGNGANDVKVLPDWHISCYEVFYGSYKDDSFSEDKTTSRSPLESNTDIGMLNKVIFPTGGTMEIKYESHEYDKYVKRTSASYFTPVLVKNSIGRKAGGLRVKTIKRDQNITAYFYQNSLQDNTSSGILINQPRIAMLLRGYTPVPFLTTISNLFFDSQSYEEDHIMYSSVIETVSDKVYSGERILLSGAISPLSETKKKLGMFSVRNPKAQLWTLTGHSYKGSSSSLYITGPVNRQYHFTAGSNPTFYNKTPEELGLPSGTYQFYLVSTEGNDGNLWGSVAFKVVETNEFIQPDQYPNGYTVERFIDWEEEKDDNQYIKTNMQPCSWSYLFHLLQHPMDKSYMRYKPKSIEVYNSNDMLLKKEVFTYHRPMTFFETAYYYHSFMVHEVAEIAAQANRVDEAKAIILQYSNQWFRINGWSMAMQKVPVELAIRQPEYKVMTEYFYDNSGNLINQIQTVEGNRYSPDMLYLKESSTTTSDGKESSSTYTYSFEGDQEPYLFMKEKNMLNTVIRQDLKEDDRLLYTKKNNFILKQATPPGSQEEKVFPVFASQDLIADGIEERRAIILRHDNYGNRVHARMGDEQGGSDVFYLWSYDGQYPVAEVAGLDDYEAFKAAAEESFNLDIDAIAHLPGGSRASLDNLRNHPNLKQAHVTTILYKPLTGIQELTDPAGKTFYYEYDPAGRLSFVYELDQGEKVITNHYQYHLIHE